MERREHRAERASVERLLTPQRIAVYGLRDRVQGLVNAMLGGGYGGDIVAVCSDGCDAAGVPNARTLAEIEGRLDLALVSVPAADMGEVVIDVAHKGAHGIVVLTGNDVRPGDNLSLVNLARAYGIRALGPDALGLINTAIELNATPGPMPRKGGVGLFCQSAAVGVAVLNYAVRSDLGVSSFISTGDYADVTANDVMQYWEDDAATRVCLLSLDSIGNPRKFSRITRRLTRRKPVVVFAPGRTSRASHSGVRGGLGHAPEEAVDALFRQAGVMVVHRRGAMIDVAKIAARQPLPSGPRVRIVTNSVTLAAQMTHTIEAVGLLHDPAPALLGSVADPAAFAEAARAALADPAYDSVVCAAVNVFDQGTEDVIWALDAVALEAGKPLVGVFLDFHPPLLSGSAVDEPGHLPRFDAAADAIHALSALSAYAHWRDRDPGAVPHAGGRRGRRPSGGERGAGRVPGRPGAHRGRDQHPAGRVRHRAGAALSGGQPGEGGRGRRPARLARGAQGDCPGRTRPARPGQRVPQHRHGGRDGRGLAGSRGIWSPTSACPATLG